VDCCEGASFVTTRDLGHAAGFEFVLGECERCRTTWMNVFCVATYATGYERVAPTDLEAIGQLADGPVLKAFMKRWAERWL
jgi:hypothetical protein